MNDERFPDGNPDSPASDQADNSAIELSDSSNSSGTTSSDVKITGVEFDEMGELHISVPRLIDGLRRMGGRAEAKVKLRVVIAEDTSE